MLIAAVVGSMLYDRFFCKYLCPMGATLGLISRLSVFKVRRTAETCIDCKACDHACPVNITVSEASTVDSPECINCNECVNACPVKDTLQVSTARGKRLSPLATTMAVVAVFGAVVLGATVAGEFQWKAPSLADEIGGGSGRGSGGNGGGSSAPLSADFDVSLIKGRTALVEVTDATGIPPALVEQVFGVPVSDQSLPMKDIMGTYGFTPEDVRTFVELYRTDPNAAASYVPLGGEE